MISKYVTLTPVNKSLLFSFYIDVVLTLSIRSSVCFCFTYHTFVNNFYSRCISMNSRYVALFASSLDSLYIALLLFDTRYISRGLLYDDNCMSFLLLFAIYRAFCHTVPAKYRVFCYTVLALYRAFSGMVLATHAQWLARDGDRYGTSFLSSKFCRHRGFC